MKGVALQVKYVDSTSVCGRSIIRGGRLSAPGPLGEGRAPCTEALNSPANLLPGPQAGTRPRRLDDSKRVIAANYPNCVRGYPFFGRLAGHVLCVNVGALSQARLTKNERTVRRRSPFGRGIRCI